MKLLYSLILLLTCSFLFSEELFTANIYSKQNPNDIAYTHYNVQNFSGDSTIIDHYYYTPEGLKYVLDRVILVKDNPVYNSLKFFLIKEFSSLEKVGDEVILTYERNGNRRQVHRKFQEPLVFAPTQQDAISNNMDLLLDGEAVNFYIFASEVLRLVKMKVKIIENSPYEKQDCVVFQMKPNNIFLDWFVDEVFYVVNKENGRIIEMHGFSTLRQFDDGEWVFRDMDFYYNYK